MHKKAVWSAGGIRILQRDANSGQASIKTEAGGVKSGSLRSFKSYPCSGCGGQYSKPFMQKGEKHKNCRASPRGRFRVAHLVEATIEGIHGHRSAEPAD